MDIAQAKAIQSEVFSTAHAILTEGKTNWRRATPAERTYAIHAAWEMYAATCNPPVDPTELHREVAALVTANARKAKPATAYTFEDYRALLDAKSSIPSDVELAYKSQKSPDSFRLYRRKAEAMGYELERTAKGWKVIKRPDTPPAPVPLPRVKLSDPPIFPPEPPAPKRKTPLEIYRDLLEKWNEVPTPGYMSEFDLPAAECLAAFYALEKEGYEFNRFNDRFLLVTSRPMTERDRKIAELEAQLLALKNS